MCEEEPANSFDSAKHIRWELLVRDTVELNVKVEEEC